MSNIIIGFTGKSGSGKTTAGKYLATRHAFLYRPLTYPVKQFLSSIGLTKEDVYGTKKDKPLKLLNGKTPREVMGLMGLDFGRNMIGPDFWVSALDAYLTEHCSGLKVLHKIVIDDVRYQNEVDYINARGGKVFRIVASFGNPPHIKINTVHDKNISILTGIAGTISNDLGIDVFKNKVKKIKGFDYWYE